MKRLFYLICIISLPIIVFFQYDKYRRHHPESVYAFPVSDSIDVDYHDPDKVLRYFQLSEEIGAFGRYCYQEHRVDVLRSTTTDPEAGPMVERYEQMLASARFLEAKLTRSLRLKEEGFSNTQIARLEMGQAEPPQSSMPDNEVLARINDQGALVLAVQQKLREAGILLEVDGIFRTETQLRVREFQQQRGLTPSGNIDMQTLRRLWDVD